MRVSNHTAGPNSRGDTEECKTEEQTQGEGNMRNARAGVPRLIEELQALNETCETAFSQELRVCAWTAW